MHEGTVVKRVLFNPDIKNLVLHWAWDGRKHIINCSSISFEAFRRALEEARARGKEMIAFAIPGGPYGIELGLTAEAMEQVAAEIHV